MTTTLAAHECPGNQILPIQPGLFNEPDANGNLRLTGAKCDDCGQRMFPARMRCVRCYSSKVRELSLEREGKVISFTVVRQAPPGYSGMTPYVLGMVELGHDLQVLTHLVGKPVDAWSMGELVQCCALPLALDQAGQCIGMAFAFRPVVRS